MPRADGHPPAEPTPGGIVHSYQRYDPRNFPGPTAPPPEIASAAFEHMLAYGDLRELTEEELANAIRLDPSLFPRLGPSLESLAAMLRERRRKLLERFETGTARAEAARRYKDVMGGAVPPASMRDAFIKAAEEEQIAELEQLWFRQKDERSEFSLALLRALQSLGEKYQVDELSAKYAFTGREPLTVEQALRVKEELETIDALLEQLKDAAKNAQLAVIDMEALSRYADPGEMEALNRIQQEVEEYLRQEALRQGLERSTHGFRLTPAAYRLFQRKILVEIFSNLSAARTGRHSGPVIGEGAVEIERTKAYEFGDSLAHLDVTGSVLNAAARSAAALHRGRATTPVFHSDDLSIHRTRNTPSCATAVLMDMSGSMLYGGQYIQCKRLALALDGLIRAEYPGDFVCFIEMFTFARERRLAEVPAMLPKPVTIHHPVVRLRADMSDPNLSEVGVPQHFTNIQHALFLARTLLRTRPTPNRQVLLITDGLPTAHFEGKNLFMLYPPDQRTEEATMREARLCGSEGITINLFILPSWSQSSEDVRFAHAVAQATGGRALFTGGKDLDRFVLWDYVKRRRTIIG